MFTILGGLIGFVTSLIPQILHLVKDTKDKKHELEVMKLNAEIMRSGDYARLEEINARADAEVAKYAYAFYGQPVNVLWVDALAASVRPVLTYKFFALYGGLKIAEIAITGSFISVWREEDQVIFGAVIGFWFGSRSFDKMRKGGIWYNEVSSRIGNIGNSSTGNGNGGSNGNGSSITNGNGIY